MKWIKAAEVPLPIIDSHKRLHVKYKGKPEILVRINNAWFWLSDGNAMEYPLVESSLECIEWLCEEYEIALTELVKAGEALMKIDFHDEVQIYKKSWHSASSMDLVKAKAKMDGALRKAKSIVSI